MTYKYYKNGTWELIPEVNTTTTDVPTTTTDMPTTTTDVPTTMEDIAGLLQGTEGTELKEGTVRRSTKTWP